MGRSISKLESFYMRHRIGIHDLGLLFAALAVLFYVAYSVDIFVTENTVSNADVKVELNEMLLLGIALAVGLFVFAIRRYLEQKNEAARRREAERHARELAFQDTLTGLANRRQFEDALRVAVASPPASDSCHAILLLDLNGFKKINDTYGHGIGDEVLIIVAQRLLGAVRPGDLVARLGGDEFIILAQHLLGPEAAGSIAVRIVEALTEPVVTGSMQHQIGTGIGIALLPDDATEAAEAIRKADVALYRAKAEQRSAMRFFEESMDRLLRERADMERGLRAAIADGRVQPLFRPTLDLQTGAVVGFELVPSWRQVDGSEVETERFLAIAEASGLIHEIAAHLLRAACVTARSWPNSITLSMDILPGQLIAANFSSSILDILRRENFDARRLELEVSESAVVGDLDTAKAALTPLRSAGVNITLDNFGTGYSNLYHMQEFQFDKVKIDRRFTDHLGDRDAARMVRALAGLGQGLGLVVSAEGAPLEKGSRAALLESGVQQAQSTTGLLTTDYAARYFLDA